MARNTERPIPIQEGIEISLAENLLKVSGKNGDLSMSIHPSVVASTPEKELLFVPKEETCLLYTSPSPRDKRQSRMPSSA